MSTRARAALIVVLLAGVGVWQVGEGAWIFVKARLAQQLLQHLGLLQYADRCGGVFLWGVSSRGSLRASAAAYRREFGRCRAGCVLECLVVCGTGWLGCTTLHGRSSFGASLGHTCKLLGLA